MGLEVAWKIISGTSVFAPTVDIANRKRTEVGVVASSDTFAEVIALYSAVADDTAHAGNVFRRGSSASKHSYQGGFR